MTVAELLGRRQKNCFRSNNPIYSLPSEILVDWVVPIKDSTTGNTIIKKVKDLSEQEMVGYTLDYIEKYYPEDKTIILEIAKIQKANGFATLGLIESALTEQGHNVDSLSYKLRRLRGPARILKSTLWDNRVRELKYSFVSDIVYQNLLRSYSI
jgi:hypothetical protein